MQALACRDSSLNTLSTAQVADLEADEETEGRLVKVRALIVDEQFGAAVAEARAAAEAHRGNGAVHEVPFLLSSLLPTVRLQWEPPCVLLVCVLGCRQALCNRACRATRMKALYLIG